MDDFLSDVVVALLLALPLLPVQGQLLLEISQRLVFTHVAVVGLHQDLLSHPNLLDQLLRLPPQPTALLTHVFHLLPILFLVSDHFQSLGLQLVDIEVSFLFIFECFELSS